MIALTIALELTPEESEDLLQRAGYGFSQCIKEDLIVLYFIENQTYDMGLINEVLEHYGLPQLGKSEP